MSIRAARSAPVAPDPHPRRRRASWCLSVGALDLGRTYRRSVCREPRNSLPVCYCTQQSRSRFIPKSFDANAAGAPLCCSNQILCRWLAKL